MNSIKFTNKATQTPRTSMAKRDAIISMVLFATTVTIGIAMLVQFQPGAMSPDSISILSQARSGILEDGHPPLLACIWGVLDRIVAGPAGMLIFNLVFYYGGLFLIFKWASRFSSNGAMLALLFVGSYPPLIGIIGVIWIDITLAGFLLTSFGLILTASTTRSLPALRVALIGFAWLLMFGAVAIRHNGAAATLPFVAISFLFILRKSNARFTGRMLAAAIALAGIVTVLAFVGAQILSSRIVEIPKHLWRVAAIYDIAGISHYERISLFDHDVFGERPLKDIDALYSPRSVAPLLLGTQIHALPGEQQLQAPRFDYESMSPELDPALLENWRKAVLHHPGSYLRHRASVFQSLVTRSPWGLWGPVFGGIYPNKLGVPPRDDLEGRFFQEIWKLSFSTPLFIPVIYLFLTALAFIPTLVLAFRRQRDLLLAASALYASGLCHMAGLFFTAASADYRYSHWLVASTVVATALVSLDLAASFYRGSRQPSERSTR